MLQGTEYPNKFWIQIQAQKSRNVTKGEKIRESLFTSLQFLTIFFFGILRYFKCWEKIVKRRQQDERNSRYFYYPQSSIVFLREKKQTRRKKAYQDPQRNFLRDENLQGARVQFSFFTSFSNFRTHLVSTTTTPRRKKLYGIDLLTVISSLWPSYKL